MNDRQVVEDELARYRNFEECLLEEFRWRDAGRVLELELLYIWADADAGAVLDDARRVVVRLGDAVAVTIESPLTAVMLENPDRLNWGVKEIAQLRVARPTELAARPEGLEDMLQLVAAWEGRGRIDILFRTMAIEELDPPRRSSD